MKLGLMTNSNTGNVGELLIQEFFYLGMVIFYFPVIFGKECENLGNKKLLAKRKDVRFFVLIHVLLLLASQLQSGAR